MNRKTVSSCALRLESLEEKALLAGDVSVAIVDGDLLIHGDHEANHIQIQSNPMTEQVVIRGLPDASGSETTLNGQSTPIVYDGIGRDVRVRMGRGADTVDVARGVFSNLAIGMGRGDDLVRLGGGVSPDGGGRLNVAGNLAVHLAAGNDRLSIQRTSIGGHAFLGGGRGADQMALQNLNANRAIVRSGPGHDRVNIAESEISRLAIHTGRGNDQVSLIDSAMADLRVNLGRGNDHLAVGSTTVANTVFVNGGEGRDRLTLFGNNEAGRFAITNFEAIRDGTDESSSQSTDAPSYLT